MGNNLTFEMEFEETGETLDVSFNLLYYFGDEPDEYMWNSRGMKAHSGAPEREKDLRSDLTDKYMEQFQSGSSLREKVHEFARRAFEVLQQLEEDPERTISSLIGNRKIFLAIGFYRSGGTYLINNLMQAQGLDIKKFTKEIIHDRFIPFEIAVRARSNQEAYRQVLFYIAQWLVWSEREFDTNCQYIVKKSSALVSLLNRLPEILGPWAEIIFHVRHPYPSMLSYNDYIGNEGWEPEDYLNRNDYLNHWYGIFGNQLNVTEKKWQQKSFYEKFVLAWITYHKTYLDSIDQLSSSDINVHAITFGEEYEHFVSEFFEKLCSDDKPDSFSPKNRFVPEVFFEQELHQHLVDLRKSWENMGLKWPDPNL